MAASVVVPQTIAVASMARLTAIWARGLADLLRPPAAAPAVLAAPPVPTALAPLDGDDAAPALLKAQVSSSEASQTTTDARRDYGPDAAMTEARDVLAGAPPEDAPQTPAAGPDRAEETGGPEQDTTTLVDRASRGEGKRSDPDGTIA